MNKTINFKKILAAVAVILILSTLLTGCGESKNSETEKIVFPEFTAVDFEGNEISSEVFADKAVTVITFWFTGCSACVSEMPQIEEINNALGEKDAALFGVCTDVSSLDGSLSVAKYILKENGANYTNIVFNGSDEVNQFVKDIYAYPTMMFINRAGEIVGEPIVGAISSKEDVDDVLSRIDEIIKADEAK